jgi:hypothetical protein
MGPNYTLSAFSVRSEYGGGCGIQTHESPYSGELPVFKTGAIGHSANPPKSFSNTTHRVVDASQVAMEEGVGFAPTRLY